MQTFLVLTFLAEDRPGLVEKLSDAVTHEGGNWLESRMARLAGQFAGIVKVEIPQDRVPSFRDALRGLEGDGFRLTVEDTSNAGPTTGSLLSLDLIGPDHPGIVREITRCLADRGASVEEMETNIQDAPMGGGTLFSAQIRVRMPSGPDDGALRQAIEGLAAALMVDITVRDEPDGDG